MGFMDKAKELAEQAQQKLEEAQRQRAERQGETQPSDATRHDKPVEEEQPPAGTAPPPSAEPVEAGGDAPDDTPDPSKPIQ